MNKYLLKGDISGIQEFIFNVSSKKAAKSLKARSFYVQLVGDLAMKYILKNQSAGYKAEVLYNGGGNFFLNIETNEDIKEQVRELQKVIDGELKHDEFYVSLAFIEYKYKDGKEDFGAAWTNIATESNKNKLKKFANSYEKLFEPYSFDNAEEAKDNQRWFDVTNYIYEGIVNKRWATVTDLMVKKNYLKTKLFNLTEDGYFKRKFDFISNKLPLWNEEDIFWEETAELRKQITERETAKDSEYKAPKDGNIIDFTFISEFARERTGTAKLGILKIDVDDLSKLFRDIDNEEDGKKRSAQLEYFFDTHIYKIWEDNFSYSEYSRQNIIEQTASYKYNIYPVFTGGDDCFFVGAWDAIMLFTKKVSDDFSDFVKGNIEYEIKGVITKKEDKEIRKNKKEHPTLSAGIVIVDEHFPVVQFAELANGAIGDAKKRKDPTSSKDDKKPEIIKNVISLFGEIFTWPEYNEIIEVSDRLTELIATNEASKGDLQRIRNSASGFERMQEGAAKGHLNFPRVDRLQYYLRNAKFKAEKYYEEHIFTNYKEALLNAFNGNLENNPMKYPAATRIAEFKLRKIKTDETQRNH